MDYTIRAKLHFKEQYPILVRMAEHLSNAQRKYFVQSAICGRKAGEIKNGFLKSEEITARQFNAIAFDVKGIVQAQKEIKKNLILKTQKKIKKIKEKIKSSNSPPKVHQFKRQLGKYESRLERYKKDLKNPSVCFGSKKLFKNQFHLKENGYSSHAEWKAQWQERRNSQFFLIGSKDESFGNQSCQLLPGKLWLRLTDRLAKELGYKRVEVPVEFTYQRELLAQAVAEKRALHFRFVRHENGNWYVHLTFSLKEAARVTDPQFGALGVDLNPSCVALTEVDAYGNLRTSEQIPTQLRGKTSEQVTAILGDLCAQIVKKAKQAKVPIIAEELDFENKKLQTRSRGMNRMLSQFAYSQFLKILKSQAWRSGVELKLVNPAYTSVIGKVKFSLGYGLSTHLGAAMAIARRGLNFGERLRVKSKFRLSLPVRNRAKHVWADWVRREKLPLELLHPCKQPCLLWQVS
jgi:IS605 OrfB family transposase